MKDVKYYIYARKSSESEDRQILSIDSQIDELKELAQKNGLRILDTKFESKSAKQPNRPVFNEIIEDIKLGKVQGIIVWHPDRLSRNSIDTGNLIYLFDLEKLEEIVTPAQNFRNTPSDKFLLNLLCSQAKLDNDNKGINVKRGLKTSSNKGFRPSPAPQGYLDDKYTDSGSKRKKKDPERFDVIRKMFDLMLTGNYTADEIRVKANEEWGYRTPKGNKMSRSTIYGIFSNTFYYGEYEYPIGSGKWYKGTHDPMITFEEYEIIQKLMGRRSRKCPKRHQFNFTGMINCEECGASITAERKIKKLSNGNIRSYIYYHCTHRKDPNCSQGSIEEKELIKQIKSRLKEIKVDNHFHSFAMRWWAKTNEKEVQARQQIQNQQRRDYEETVKLIDGYSDMRAKGEISENEYKEKKGNLLEKKTKLMELLNDTDNRMNKWLETGDRMLLFTINAIDKLENGTIEERRSVLSSLGSDLTIKDKKLNVSLTESLFPLKKVSKELEAINERLEPQKSPLKQSDYDEIYLTCPNLLPDLDSNQD